MKIYSGLQKDFEQFDKIHQESIGNSRHLVGSDDRNPVIRIRTKFDRIPRTEIDSGKDSRVTLQCGTRRFMMTSVG